MFIFLCKDGDYRVLTTFRTLWRNEKFYFHQNFFPSNLVIFIVNALLSPNFCHWRRMVLLNGAKRRVRVNFCNFHITVLKSTKKRDHAQNFREINSLIFSNTFDLTENMLIFLQKKTDRFFGDFSTLYVHFVPLRR